MTKQLLLSVTKKDFIIEWYSGTGSGGQYRNKHQNCCRIKHLESGSVATGTESRSRDDNLKTAFKRLVKTNTFTTWLKKRSSEELLSVEEKKHREMEIERWVDEQMKEENIKVEYI